MDPIWTQPGQSRDRGAEIFDVQVAVDSGRRAHVVVPQQALNAMRVDAGTEKQRCGCVAQIMEAHRPRDRFRSQGAPARLREKFACAIGAFGALRAVALLVVGMALAMAAPAADVVVAFNEAGAREGRAQDLLRVRLGRPLRAVSRGEDERAGRVLDLVLEDGQQRRRDRDQVGVPTLGSVALV